MLASRKGNDEIVKLLVEGKIKADVNARNNTVSDIMMLAQAL